MYPTPGDGNCFYHAVIEALSVTNKPYVGNHKQSRTEIVSFVDNNRGLDFIQNWERTILDEKLCDVIAQQYQSGTFANELFIRATAIKLQLAILCTKEDSTEQYPYDIFLPTTHLENMDMSSFLGTFIILGHRRLHFQSLRFKGDLPPWNGNYIPYCHKTNVNSLKMFFPKMCPVKKSNKIQQFTVPEKKRKIDNALNRLYGESKVDFGISKANGTKEDLKSNDSKPKTRSEPFDSSSKPKEDSKSTKKRLKHTEKKLKEDCQKWGIEYIHPIDMESLTQCKERRKKLRNSIRIKKPSVEKVKQKKTVNERKALFRERKLEQDCKNQGIEYVPPTSTESPDDRMARRKQLRSLLSSLDQNGNTFLHKNPKVHNMISNFSNGENRHNVIKCKSCYELRPYFHVTTPIDTFSGDHKPYEVQSWKVFDDGRCNRCHEETKKKKKEREIFWIFLITRRLF